MFVCLKKRVIILFLLSVSRWDMIHIYHNGGVVGVFIVFVLILLCCFVVWWIAEDCRCLSRDRQGQIGSQGCFKSH